jgi:hypothetical protein
MDADDMDSNGSACPVKREMLMTDCYHMMNVIVTDHSGADREVLIGHE